jgi:Domain of unknown function (DUF1990)
VDRTRIKLGEGAPVFQAAKAALRHWRQFDLGWLEAWSPETPIQTGEVVAIVARAIGLWWLNACKIVYVVDESGPISRFGPERRRAILDRVGSGRRQSVVRHLGVLPGLPMRMTDRTAYRVRTSGMFTINEREKDKAVFRD